MFRQPDTNRPYMTQAEAKEFTRSFMELNSLIINRLKAARTMKEAKEPLSMLENLAKYDLPQAKTMYGLALLMDDKPWYNVGKAEKMLKKGAEEAAKSEHDASFSMYQYGMLLLNGDRGITQDPITGKYWIEKAADNGYREAVEERKRWQ